MLCLARSNCPVSLKWFPRRFGCLPTVLNECHRRYFDVTPLNFELSLHAMSVEKLEFLLPAVMTIGPRIEEASLIKYARLMTGRSQSNVPELVKGVIEGETRVIAAGMSMEEIFKVRLN